MRIDEFKKIPSGAINIVDRFRIVTVGFEFSVLLNIVCLKYLHSAISSLLWSYSTINNELFLNSAITKEIKVDGDLCW